MGLLLSFLLLGCSDSVPLPVADSGVQALPVWPTIPPFAHLTGPDTAVLRFETDVDVPLSVRLIPGDCQSAACETVEKPERIAAEYDFAFPDAENTLELEHHDSPGLRVRHSLDLDLGTPGSVLGWELDLGGGETLTGTVTAPPADGVFRAVFVGDTMHPISQDVLQLAAAEAPELWIHGGDIQYQTSFTDTWTGFFWNAQPVTQQALVHFALGNHELEGQDEFRVMWLRLITGQGDAAQGELESQTGRFHGFTYGGVRFLALDTEEGLNDPVSQQLAWLDAELQAAQSDPDIWLILPYFHRPSYTLAAHPPRTDIRMQIEPRFAASGKVALVLQAHNHAYERFEVPTTLGEDAVEGTVHWVVDGGGGALLYNVDSSIDEHPDDLPYRIVGRATNGFTRLDFDPAVGVTLSRTTRDGEAVDSVVIPAP